MIRLGLSDQAKREQIEDYRRQHPIRNVVVLSPEAFDLRITDTDRVEFAEIIEYRHYYRLIREIGTDSLVVVNECLRTQNRHDLTFNCIRNFLLQTRHVMVFQTLPLIATFADFMVLLDWETRSRYKRLPFTRSMLDEVDLQIQRMPISFEAVSVATTKATKQRYEAERERLFAGLGNKDPHTLPRNLYQVAGKDRLKRVDSTSHYLGRNNRFGLGNLTTYAADRFPHRDYIVFELPHNYIDFIDVITLTGQTAFPVLVTELKADQWYLRRFQEWSQRVQDAYAALHR